MIPTYAIEFNEKEQKGFKLTLQDVSNLVEEAVRLYISINIRTPTDAGWNPPLTYLELDSLVSRALNEFEEQHKIIDKNGKYYWYTEKEEEAEGDVLG